MGDAKAKALTITRGFGAPLWPIRARLGAGNKTTHDFDFLLGGRGSDITLRLFITNT